jgi:hypothetical protein
MGTINSQTEAKAKIVYGEREDEQKDPIYQAWARAQFDGRLSPGGLLQPLNEVERACAWLAGSMTYKSSQKRRFTDYQTASPENGASGERIQQLGCLAEFAMFKFLDIFPFTFNTYRGADWKGILQVRLIGDKYYGLRVYEKDADDVLVAGTLIEKNKEEGPHWLAGFVRAGDARRQADGSHGLGIWMNPNDGLQGFHAVPQAALRPMKELKPEMKRLLALKRSTTGGGN